MSNTILAEISLLILCCAVAYFFVVIACNANSTARTDNRRVEFKDNLKEVLTLKFFEGKGVDVLLETKKKEVLKTKNFEEELEKKLVEEFLEKKKQ